MNEAINSPKHYTSHKSGVEAIEICELIGFNLGAAFKYLFRRDVKHESPITDLEKALWYVRREIRNTGYGDAPYVSDLPEPLIGDFEGDFFAGCYDELADMTCRVVAHERAFVAGAMAYIVRGYEYQDAADLAIAAHYIEREIAKLNAR